MIVLLAGLGKRVREVDFDIDGMFKPNGLSNNSQSGCEPIDEFEKLSIIEYVFVAISKLKTTPLPILPPNAVP